MKYRYILEATDLATLFSCRVLNRLRCLPWYEQYWQDHEIDDELRDLQQRIHLNLSRPIVPEASLVSPAQVESRLRELESELGLEHQYQQYDQGVYMGTWGYPAFSVCEMEFEPRIGELGNGRFVKNIFDRCIAIQCNRLAVTLNPSKDDLTAFLVTDIPSVEQLEAHLG